MLHEFKENLFKINRQLKIKLFGNVMTWATNIIYFTYDFIYYFKNRNRAQSEDMRIRDGALSLARDGFLVIDEYVGGDLINGIAAQAESLLSSPENYDESIRDLGVLRVRGSCVCIQNLTVLTSLPFVEAVLNEYYGGDYGIFSSDVYRTFPVDEKEERLESLKWHVDNGPRNMVKIFVYLSDTGKDSGAITLVPKNVSSKYIRRGIYFRDDLAAHSNDIDQYGNVIEGCKGTIILFTPQLNVHKATLPLTLYRDAAVFLIHPALTERSVVSDEEKWRVSKNYGYMINPFKWTPLRIGDQ